jgi:hypothetical protein
MSGQLPTDPELDLAELYLDLGDMFEWQFEYWMRQADDEPRPRLRALIEEIAADAMLIANAARADADDLMRDYDDGFGS